jgi:hypothetical protein
MKLRKLELVLAWATLHFVGWVEPAPSFFGFRCTQPNLHFAGVIAKYETQQRSIFKPSLKSFFFDQTGRFSGQRRRSCETSYEITLSRNSEQIERSSLILDHFSSFIAI